MNLLHFVVLCPLILASDIPPTVVEPLENEVVVMQPIAVHSELVQLIRIVASTEYGERITVILKPTDQKLANENLPIWTVHQDNFEMQAVDNLMRDIGLLTMYHDVETTSAAIFFHKQQKFYGIIDSRQVINGLFWDPNENPGRGFCTTGVINRRPSRFFTDVIPGEESGVSVQLENHLLFNEVWDGKSMETELRESVPNTFYIETLVLVNNDMVQKLQTHPHDYEAIVSYVLTLMNSNDLLYSKIRDPVIKFNIAGIIIATSRESFPLHASGRCNYPLDNGEGLLVDHMNVRCSNEFIRTFCGKHKQTIPPGSYDIAILLTNYGLHHYNYDPKTGEKKLNKLGGLAESPKSEYYELMKTGHMRTLVATVSDEGEYESFPILAHEIAHLLTVDHDERLHKLMQPRGKHNRKSLSWSPASRTRLKYFFSSRGSCMFLNKPRSLHSGPQKMLSADEQCQCYNYKSAKIGILNRLKGRIGVDCDDNIQCDDKYGKSHEGPVFMDGTPCGPSKVCWAEKCENTRLHFHLLPNCGGI